MSTVEAVDALLVLGFIALLIILAALMVLARWLQEGPEWPEPSAHDEADDGGEAASAARQEVRASGSRLASESAPASPHRFSPS